MINSEHAQRRSNNEAFLGIEFEMFLSLKSDGLDFRCSIWFSNTYPSDIVSHGWWRMESVVEASIQSDSSEIIFCTISSTDIDISAANASDGSSKASN